MPKKNRRLYPDTVYISAGHPTAPNPCIDLDSYMAKYFLTRNQVLSLVRKRKLKAVSYKHKLFVEDIDPKIL